MNWSAETLRLVLKASEWSPWRFVDEPEWVTNGHFTIRVGAELGQELAPRVETPTRTGYVASLTVDVANWERVSEVPHLRIPFKPKLHDGRPCSCGDVGQVVFERNSGGVIVAADRYAQFLTVVEEVRALPYAVGPSLNGWLLCGLNADAPVLVVASLTDGDVRTPSGKEAS